MFKTFMNFFILEKGINIKRWSSYLKKKKTKNFNYNEKKRFTVNIEYQLNMTMYRSFTQLFIFIII